MKTIITLLISLLACVVVSDDFAKDKDAKKKQPIKDIPLPDVTVDENAIALLKPFDKNGDMQIDKEEFVALAAAYKADPTGPLKQFHITKTAELDDFVDRAKINNTLGTVAAKKTRDADELKRQERVAKLKAEEAKEAKSGKK